MFRFIRNIIFGLILIACIQCDTGQHNHTQKSDKKNTSLNVTQFHKFFSSNMERIIRKDTSIAPLRYFDTIIHFYQNNPPIFIHALEKNKFTNYLDILKSADLKGLDKTFYHYPSLKTLYKEITLSHDINSTDQYIKLSKLEFLTAHAMICYYSDLNNGRTNPDSLFGFHHSLHKDTIQNNIFLPLNYAENPQKLNSLFAPKNDRFGLNKALTDYHNRIGIIDWNLIPDSIRIEPRDTSDYIFSIAQKLMILGDLDSTAYASTIAKYRLKNNIDSLKNLCFYLYDTSIASAIANFQTRHGLKSDSIIGKYTINALNISPEERYNQLCINLERLHWHTLPDTGIYFWINIPDFKLYIYNNHEVKLISKVCTGQKKEKNYKEKLKKFLESTDKNKTKKDKPKNHETPTLESDIRYFVLNPEWIIPKSIAENEIIYKLIKDTSYLTKENLEVFSKKDKSKINADTIDWIYYLDKELPYRIKQKPGSGNSLGQIKFYFPNRYDVYIHDTPSKYAFHRTNRAVSHGCVRLEYPMKVLEFITKQMKDVHMDDLRIELGYPPLDKTNKDEYEERKERFEEFVEELEENDYKFESKIFYLDKEIPVIIDYLTAWQDSLGRVNFRQDVYDRDKVLSDAFFKY